MLATRLPTAPRRETHAAGAASRKAGARLRGSRWRPRPLPRLENTSHGPALGSGLGDVALGKARVCPNSEQKQRWCRLQRSAGLGCGQRPGERPRARPGGHPRARVFLGQRLYGQNSPLFQRL